MRGPIDFIVVGFPGNKFDGSIVQALEDAMSKGIIDVLSLSVVVKDAEGNVTTAALDELGDEYIMTIAERTKDSEVAASTDDIDEVGELMENNTAAGLLIIEQLWAKPLKSAIVAADGVLLSEGRIHPDAAQELSKEEN